MAAPVVETPAPAAPAVTGPQDAESATSMLALAQRVHDEYVRDGEEQSAKIIAEANAERDAIIADAQKQKDSLLSQLDQERELLENKINGLRTFEAEYRSNCATTSRPSSKRSTTARTDCNRVLTGGGALRGAPPPVV